MRFCYRFRKYEEIYPPELKEFVQITDETYTHNQVRSMERRILDTIDFCVAAPTPYFFMKLFANEMHFSERYHTSSHYDILNCSQTAAPTGWLSTCWSCRRSTIALLPSTRITEVPPRWRSPICLMASWMLGCVLVSCVGEVNRLLVFVASGDE